MNPYRAACLLRTFQERSVYLNALSITCSDDYRMSREYVASSESAADQSSNHSSNRFSRSEKHRRIFPCRKSAML